MISPEQTDNAFEANEWCIQNRQMMRNRNKNGKP